MDTNEMTLMWFDYTTNEYVPHSGPMSEEDAQRFLPQHPAAQGLYRVYREMGDDTLNAMRKVLEYIVSIKKESN